MEVLTGMVAKGNKIYVLINKENGAVVESTEKYLPQWLARGFEVLEIKGVVAPSTNHEEGGLE